MYAGAVADIKTYVIDIAVVIVIVAQHIAGLNVLGRYGGTECRDLCCIMRQTDAIVIRIYV